MKQNRFEISITKLDDELVNNTALFFEADRLEAYAYSLIEADCTSTVSWKGYREAKALADLKRTEAREDLLRIRGQHKKKSARP